MIAFLWTPELVEHLLSFLDAPSILNLARAHAYTMHVLQKPLVWAKVIRRACPFGKEEDRSLLNTIMVERKRDQVRALVGLLELLEDRDDHHLNLLELICERFPPLTAVSAFGQQCVSLNDFKISPGYSVSPLGFLLLEEVETSKRLADDHVVGVEIDNLVEPLLTVLSQRADIQEERVEILRIGTIVFNNDQDVMLFSTLFASTSYMVGGALDIGDDVGAEGWAELAKLLVEGDALWLFEGINVWASRQAMVKSRREDLRTIWEASLDGGVEDPVEGTFWYVGIGCGSDLAERTYRDWERLVEIMEMTEEEWDGENQQE